MSMMKICILLHLCTYIINIYAGNVSTSEMNALTALYAATNGDNWRWFPVTYGIEWDFVNKNNPCIDNWQGITCNSGCSLLSTDICTINSIVLEEHRLEGTLPDELGLLTSIVTISMYVNRISGTLPLSLSNMTDLSSLDVGINGFRGGIPQLSTKLSYLYLGYNRFSGEFPTTFGTLTNLAMLEMDANVFTGTLPTLVGNMKSLTQFEFHNNKLTGTFPMELGDLSLLQHLECEFNRFSGSLPETFSKLSLLTQLKCGNNWFTGSFPSVLLTLTKMKKLQLGDTNCTGTLPNNFGVMNSLERLDLSVNQYSGNIPESLYTIITLTTLDIGHTLINGTISQNIGLLTKLNKLSLRFSYFSGTLPSAFGDMSSLHFVDMTTNLLTGSVISDFGKLLELKTLDLSANLFHGTISTSIFGASLLTALVLDTNSISGTFPTQICTLSSLKNINFQENLFSSTLPTCLGNIIFMNTITVSYNSLTGTLPSSLPQLNRLNTLIINNNYFTGTIPTSYADCRVLNSFLLHDNAFSGALSDPPRLPQTLVTVDMASNQFTGTLPTYLFHSSSPIQVLSASNNCFSGSLSSEVCLIANLSTLVLNGLSSSGFCSREMIDLTHRVYYANFVPGTIPPCYFDMPNLKSLYLSGNGLTGTMSDMSKAISLQNLYISYNQLTGRIPSSLLQSGGNLRNVDLSTNRLSGTIDEMSNEFLHSSDIDGLSIYLQNNRISGKIPATLNNISNSNNLTVNILAGNMFSCSVWVRNVLPSDPNNESYVCGSNDLDSMMFLTVILLFVVCVVCGLMLRNILSYRGSAEAKLWQDLVVWATQYIVWKNTSRAANKHMQRLADVFSVFRLYTSVIALVSLIVFLPLYTILKYVNNSYYGQYTYQYGWIISVGFMQGTVPAAIIASVIIVCIGIFTFFFRGVEENTVINGETKGRTNSADFTASYINMRKGSATDRRRRKYQLFILGICNFAIVCIINGGYVYVLLYEEIVIQLLCTILVVGFKLLWNPAVIVPVCRMMHVSHLITFYVLIFNNILIPIAATAAVDVSCYQSLFVVPDTITDVYVDRICSFYANDTCAFNYLRAAETTFDPPWIYSFQCSSSVFRNYIAVYVAMYAFIGLVLPVLRIGIMVYFNECFTGRKVRGSWSRSSSFRRQSSSFLASTSFSNTFSYIGSSFANVSIYKCCFNTNAGSSTENAVTTAQRLKQKMSLLKWIKTRVILYSMIRMCLPIQSINDFLYENGSATVDNNPEESEEEEEEGVSIKSVQSGEEFNISSSNNPIENKNNLDSSKDNTKTFSEEKNSNNNNNNNNGNSTHSHSILMGHRNLSMSIRGNRHNSVNQYFDMHNKLVANDVFYGTTSNCFNLAVALVMLVTFGVAYPPLAIIISIYLITSTLTMQLCLHYHFLQVTSLGEHDSSLLQIWNSIVDLELKTVNEILFGVNQSAAILCGMFFSMFFVDMTFTWYTSLIVVLLTIVIIIFRIYWDRHNIHMVSESKTHRNSRDINRKNYVDTKNSNSYIHGSTEGVELHELGGSEQGGDNTDNENVINPILRSTF